MRVTVGESGVLERRLMTERITDLRILESTEVKIWINTLQKWEIDEQFVDRIIRILLIKLSELLIFLLNNQNSS